MEFPIGLQSFGDIRRKGYVYLDKTSYIQPLLRNGKYKFLSRPRRFGKSLLVSMLECFFKGERELFKGLAIDQLLSEPWESYPVIHLDFSGENYGDTQTLENKLNSSLEQWETKLDLSSASATYSERFRRIIRALHETTGSQVVVLIDEYDNPITSSIGNSELQEQLRNILYGFYSSLKSLDDHLHFCLLTGVTKYGHLSVFSGLNNLMDISMMNEFAGICGITEEELHGTLNPAVQDLAEDEGIDIDSACGLLKDWYDGYHFSKSLLDVYNPFSVMSVLARRDVSDFWYQSGKPTILVKSMQKDSIDISELNGAKASEDMLGNISAFDINPIALLYQTGYLTIKSYDRSSRIYTLGYPNKEVQTGLMDTILNTYGNISDSRVLVSKLRSFLEKGEAEKFVATLKSFFANVPYDLRKNLERYENYYHSIFYVLLQLIGMDVEAEYHTSEESIDILIKTKSYIYIIELKVNGTAEEALAQINEKRYSESFATDDRCLIKMGTGFALETHTIDSYIIE